MLEHAVGVELVGLGKEAGLGAEAHDRLGVALDHGPRHGDLELDRSRRHPLEQPEVEERHASIRQQHRVAGVGVAGELVVAVEAPEVEAEHDLADPIAILLGVELELLESRPLHVLGDQHELAGERGHDLGDHDERVGAENPRQRALVLGLELVVELFLDAIPDLLAESLRVHPRRDPLGQPKDQSEVLHVGADRPGDAGVLNLDRHRRPSLSLAR